MKKKFVLGSVFVILLMLVSTQTVFLNIVKSEPTVHTGDADVGSLWITELDVSTDLTTIDYVGISHVNASDDWVLWENGTGNITADWSVDIERNHPEYYVLIGMVVYNIDDSNKEIGNDSYIKTYTTNLDYDESGTLTVALNFTQQQQQAGSQTLVCYLDTQSYYKRHYRSSELHQLGSRPMYCCRRFPNPSTSTAVFCI